MLVYIILSVFIAGLMVGRTPEYLGKKIQAFEVQMAMLTVLIFSLLILTFTAISSVSPGFGTSSIFNRAPTGWQRSFTPIHRRPPTTAPRSAALASTRTGTITLGVTMLFGRYFMIIPPLAIAGQPEPEETPSRRRSARSPLRRRSFGAPSGRDPHRRGADVLSRSEPRPDRLALDDERGTGVLVGCSA